jgi:flavorubredoxin
MKNDLVLFDDSVHKCIMFSFDDEEHEDRFLSVNQYLVLQRDSAVLIDPGSEAVFDEMVDAVEKYISIDKIKFIFFSHQDPDVAGSITLWSVAAPNAKIVLSKIWVRFMSHYGLADMSKILPVEDKGAKIEFGQDYFKFVPAHFLHSPGNFSLYDSRSKILFSGDIGAAVVPVNKLYKEVSDFNSHVSYLESFHKRYMASNLFTSRWVRSFENMNIDIIAPQHGAIFKDSHVKEFLNWFSELKCGSDFIDDMY